MSKPLLQTERAVAQRKEGRKNKEYVRLMEQLEFCVRNKVDPAKVLIDLDSFRNS